MSDDDHDVDDNVIAIDTRMRLGTLRATAEIKTTPMCAHANVELDEDERVVTCRRCQRKIDAFDVLMRYAKRERSFVYTSKQMLEERARVEREVEDLKRVRANLNAQIRRRTRPP